MFDLPAKASGQASPPPFTRFAIGRAGKILKYKTNVHVIQAAIDLCRF